MKQNIINWFSDVICYVYIMLVNSLETFVIDLDQNS